MFGKKKGEYNLKKQLDMFNEHLDNSDEYNYFMELYNNIKSSYLQKIRDNELDIRIERTRIEGKTGKYNLVMTTFKINFLLLGVTILINGLLLAYSVSIYGSTGKLFIMFGLATIMDVFIVYSLNKYTKRDNGYVLDLALKVLEDIEKEVVGEQAKIKEELEILEKRKWIEQNFNKGKLFKRRFIDAHDEVAATEIQSTDHSDKKPDKFVKNIGDLNGFINIIFFKKFSNKK